MVLEAMGNAEGGALVRALLDEFQLAYARDGRPHLYRMLRKD